MSPGGNNESPPSNANPSATITYERFGSFDDHDDDDDDDNDNYGIAGISPCNSDKRHLPRRASSTDSQEESTKSTSHQHQPNHNRTRTRTNGSSSSPDHRYEEFSSKLTLQCPTCKGKGKLTQGQADSMVALIPVRDKRLKPRKTKLYLGITFAVCMLVTFLVTFFLLPRSVTLEILDTQTKKIYMPDDEKSIPYIDVAVTFKIKNDNFFKADVSNIQQEISWNRFLLNSSVSNGNYKFHVNGRTEKNHTILSRQIFQGDVNMKVKKVCTFGWNWVLLEMFVNTATVSYLYRSEQISGTKYEYVKCMNTTAEQWEF